MLAVQKMRHPAQSTHKEENRDLPRAVVQCSVIPRVYT